MSNDEYNNGFNFLNMDINEELKDEEDNNENEEINKPIIKNDLKIKGFILTNKRRKNVDQNGEREYINNGNTDHESISEIFEIDEEANISKSKSNNNNNKKRKNRESSSSPTTSKNNAKRTKSKKMKDENSNDEENNNNDEKKENGIHYGEEDMADEVNGEEKKKMMNTIYLKLKKIEQEMERDREDGDYQGEDEWMAEKEYSVGTNNMAMALSAWIEGNNKKIRKEIEEKNNQNNSNNMTNLMSIDELTIRLKSVCKDERFSSGDNIAESLTTTMQTSLSINLHPHHFSIGNNITSIYPYDRNTRNFIEMINANKISVEFLDIIRENGSVHYYEGCILIELRDFREKSSTTGQPVVKKVLLRPTYETVVHDITMFCNSKEKFSEGDRLQLESSLVLNTAKPLCLDPSPNVFYINTIINYNKHKNNVKLSKDERVKLLRSNEKPIPSNFTIPQTVFPKKKIPLFEFLSQRQNTPLIPKETKGGGGGGLAFSLSLGIVGNVPQMPETNLSSFQNVNIQDLISVVLPNHELSFSKPNGNVFFYFKLSDLPSGQFQGLIRVGDNPDKGDNGYKHKFNTGNKKSTENFVKQMVNCFIKDGYAITHDSSKQRRTYPFGNNNNNLNLNNNNNPINNNPINNNNIGNNNNNIMNHNNNNVINNNIQGNVHMMVNPNNHNPNNPYNISNLGNMGNMGSTSNIGSLNNISFNNGMGLNNSQGINLNMGLNNSQNLNNMNINNPNMMDTQEYPKYPNQPIPPRVTKIINQQPTKHPPFSNSYNPRSNSFEKKN